MKKGVCLIMELVNNNESIELIHDSLHKSGFIILKNGASGMRNLIRKDDKIGVIPCYFKELNLGDIILLKKQKLLMGSRIISISNKYINIRSDCGFGKPVKVKKENLFGKVAFIEIDKKIFPLYGDNYSNTLHKEIASLSSKVPQIKSEKRLNDLLISINPFIKIKHKILVILLRKKQKQLLNYIIQKVSQINPKEIITNYQRTSKMEETHEQRI